MRAAPWSSGSSSTSCGSTSRYQAKRGLFGFFWGPPRPSGPLDLGLLAVRLHCVFLFGLFCVGSRIVHTSQEQVSGKWAPDELQNSREQFEKLENVPDVHGEAQNAPNLPYCIQTGLQRTSKNPDSDQNMCCYQSTAGAYLDSDGAMAFLIHGHREGNLRPPPCAEVAQLRAMTPLSRARLPPSSAS